MLSVEAPARSTGHSAIVKMRLFVHDLELEVRQSGGGMLMLRNPPELPAGEAEFVISIDGAERRTRVRLPQGISPKVRWTPIQAI